MKSLLFQYLHKQIVIQMGTLLLCLWMPYRLQKASLKSSSHMRLWHKERLTSRRTVRPNSSCMWKLLLMPLSQLTWSQGHMDIFPWDHPVIGKALQNALTCIPGRLWLAEPWKKSLCRTGLWNWRRNEELNPAEKPTIIGWNSLTVWKISLNRRMMISPQEKWWAKNSLSTRI